jgi:hypothetical protein
MPEGAQIERREDSEFAIAERMSREVALLSGRLAHLLARSPAAQEEPIVRAHAFLHGMFDRVVDSTESATGLSAGSPHSIPQAPIDRLADAFSLQAAEVELILLAAMAEEHEGYASVLRSLNPNNEPYATWDLRPSSSVRIRASE